MFKRVAIRSKCARFALDAQDSIRQHPKITGEGLNDRAADTFDPLYVIARHASPAWEAKLHTAAIALTSATQSNSAAAELLLDILSVFFHSGHKTMFSRDLAAGLRDGSGGMKSLHLKDSDINERQIAKILRPYGIKPSHIRIGKEVNKGYDSRQFRTALERYVPKADLLAHIEEMRNRATLQDQAVAEAAKEKALMDQALAEMPRNRLPTNSEIMSILHRLKKDPANNASQPPSNEPAPATHP